MDSRVTTRAGVGSMDAGMRDAALAMVEQGDWDMVPDEVMDALVGDYLVVETLDRYGDTVMLVDWEWATVVQRKEVVA